MNTIRIASFCAPHEIQCLTSDGNPSKHGFKFFVYYSLSVSLSRARTRAHKQVFNESRVFVFSVKCSFVAVLLISRL